jgi:hypothetical protein
MHRPCCLRQTTAEAPVPQLIVNGEMRRDLRHKTMAFAPDSLIETIQIQCIEALGRHQGLLRAGCGDFRLLLSQPPIIQAAKFGALRL